MEISGKVEGLESAMNAMLAAFPADPKKQRGILQGTMSASAKKAMVPVAKRLALVGDGSGALSESIGIRTMSARTRRQLGVPAGVQVLPVRSNLKAMKMYIAHYYTAKGKTPSPNMITSGIRHGHLVEFGSVNNSPAPFLLPAGEVGKSAYVADFAAQMKKKTEAAVKREARKQLKARK